MLVSLRKVTTYSIVGADPENITSKGTKIEANRKGLIVLGGEILQKIFLMKNY